MFPAHIAEIALHVHRIAASVGRHLLWPWRNCNYVVWGKSGADRHARRHFWWSSNLRYVVFAHGLDGSNLLAQTVADGNGVTHVQLEQISLFLTAWGVRGAIDFFMCDSMIDRAIWERC